jgi:hypothetical protein
LDIGIDRSVGQQTERRSIASHAALATAVKIVARSSTNT